MAAFESKGGAPAPSPAREQAVALTIAGSDSGGGAGIQADIKTFAALGVFATSAITCLTAQNPEGVFGIEPVSDGMLRKQVLAVAAGFPVAAAKTGMLFSAELITATASVLKEVCFPFVVVDPVMVATSGARLLKEDAAQALCENLLPLATVMTPNLPEAEVLVGHKINSENEQARAARDLAERFETAVVIKGGHGFGDESADVLFSAGEERWYRLPRVKTTQTHGTGCTFSAALAAFLALGRPLPDAVCEAKRFVARALAAPILAGRHFPLGLDEAACAKS